MKLRKKIVEKIEKLNEATGNVYQIRKENVRPDIFRGKYFLYLRASKWGDGMMQEPGTYGLLISGFKNQKQLENALDGILNK